MRNIHEFEVKNLLRMANDAKERAYVPYSGFRVGACLKGASGAYYFGCNIENAAYSPTVCAERVAMLRAIYEGEREFDALAIVWDGDSCGPLRRLPPGTQRVLRWRNANNLRQPQRRIQNGIA